MGWEVRRRGDAQPAVDFLPRKFDHPLSKSSGGGCCPSVVRLRVTRGMPSFTDCHMARGKEGRATVRSKGKEKGKCSGRKETSQFQPVAPSEPRCILPTPKNRIKLPRNERLIAKQNKLNFLPNQPHISCFSENTGLHDLRSSVM